MINFYPSLSISYKERLEKLICYLKTITEIGQGSTISCPGHEHLTVPLTYSLYQADPKALGYAYYTAIAEAIRQRKKVNLPCDYIVAPVSVLDCVFNYMFDCVPGCTTLEYHKVIMVEGIYLQTEQNGHSDLDNLEDVRSKGPAFVIL